MKKAFGIFRRMLKFLIWTVIVLTGLLLLVIGLILFPPIQQRISGYAVDFLTEKLETEIQLKRVFIGFPTDVVIEGLYVEDEQADTLAYLQKLRVNVDMLALLDKKIIIESAYIEGLTSHIHRSAPDSIFNFSFIPEAFASDQPTPEPVDTTESEPFEIDVQHIELVNLRGSFIDETSGLDVQWVLGKFETEIDGFDLNSLSFDVDELEFSDSRINLVQHIAPAESEDDTSSTHLAVNMNSIILNNIDFNFQQKYAGTELIVELGNFELYPTEFDLVSTTIHIEELLLENSYAGWIQHKIPGGNTESTTVDEIAERTDPLATFPWNIQVEELNIRNQSFDLLDYNAAESPGQFNAQHLKIKEADIELEDLLLAAQISSVDLKHVSFFEESGIRLDELRSSISVDSSGAELRDFLLMTPRSRIDLQLISSYPSLLAVIEDPAALTADLQVHNSYFDISDLLPFVPDLNNQFPVLESDGLRVNLDTDVSGKLSDLDIGTLKASINELTEIDVSGKISGLPEIKDAQMDVVLNHFITQRQEINKILPPNTIPESINLPEDIRLSGKLQGSFENFETEFLLATSSGDADIVADLQTGADSIPHYNLFFQTHDLDLGSLLAQEDSLGPLNLRLELTGSSFNPDSAVAKLDGEIISVVYGQRTYEEILITGAADHGEIEADISLVDSLVSFALSACAELNLEKPYYRATIDLDGIDLYGMGMSSEDFRASGNLVVEAVGDSINEIDLHVQATEVLFIRDGDRYAMDSLGLALHTSDTFNLLEIESGLINGYFETNIRLDQMQDVVMRHVDKYYSVLDSADYASTNEDHYFKFNFLVENTDVLSNVLLPDLHHLSTGMLVGDFDQSADVLDVEIYFPAIEYGGFHVDSLNLFVTSVNDSLIYSLRLQEVGTEEYFLTNTELYGAFADQVLNVSLDVLDSLNNHSLFLGGNFRSEDDRYRFSFEPEGVIFDEEVWDVPEDHFLEFGSNGVLANNFSLRNGKREIRLESREQVLNAPMDLSFTRFDLAELSQAIESAENLVSGELSGNVALTFPDTLLKFDADLNITELHVMGHGMGNLELIAQNSRDAIDIQANLSGNNNDLQLAGQYRFTPEVQLTVELDMNRFELSSVEPFVSDYVDSLSGYVSGGLSLSGNPEQPQFSGNIEFNQVGMRVPQLGTYYKLNKESFSVNNKGLQLNNFTLTDEAGKTASFDGSVLTNDFLVFRFNLDANIDRFQILNKPDTPDAIFFGNVLLESRIKLRGNTNKPVIQGSAEIVEGSEMSLIIPDQEAQIENSGGIDEFIVRHQTGSDIMTRTIEEDTTVAAFTGMDLSANLKLNRESVFFIYLSEARDNYVRTQGNADLRFGIDPSGKITMTGRYELMDGEYQLIYRGVVRKKFDIEEGSSIIWMGNPLTARLDLTALHTVETDALGLLEDQLAGSNQADLNRFRQKMPFWLQLHLGGELTEPEIAFNIDLPPDHRGVFSGQVDAKLSMLNQPENESERNKQVFALLVLGRFLPGDPLSGGGSTEAAVRNNMSRLLSKQLSKLTEEHIQGVELDMELDSYEDYSSGQAEGRTELNLGVSKNFLNERLTVRVGGSIDLEGERRRKQQASDFIGDLSVEYQLTENGYWRTRGFRKNTYEGIIDGEIIETGISLIFSRSYNQFHEIFQKPEENQDSDYPEDSPEDSPESEESDE